MPFYKKQRRWEEDILDKYGYEHIMEEGGGEGGSEYCEGVFKLGGGPSGDTYFKASWSYYSHHGYETSGCADTLTEVTSEMTRQVTPVQETITVYK